MVDARELLTAQQVLEDREAWLAARRTGVTASEIAAVLRLSPWESPFGLWHRKHGILPEAADSPRLALGRHLEAYVAEQFTFLTDMRVRVCGLYQHAQRVYQLATPDRLVVSADGEPLAPLECKTSSTFDDWGPDGSDEVPLHYRCQLLWQMDTLDMSEGYLTCLFLLTQEQRVYYLKAEDGELQVMRQAALDFMAQVSPPDVDWSSDTRAALKKLYPPGDAEKVVVSRALVRSYRAALHAYAAADKRKKEMENRLRLAMGTGRKAVDIRTGEPVATRTVYDRKPYTVQGGQVDRLTPAKEKKERG
jgi:putative phage-type endonuclease